MAQWAASQDDNEQQQGVGEPHTPTNQNGQTSNDGIPHPLMDCGQGKNMSDEAGVGTDVAVGVGGDVARRTKDGKRTSDVEDDAKGNDSAGDAQEAIADVNYSLSAGAAPHPINKPLRLRTCESIPPPPHGATPKPLRLHTCESIPPPPHGATPPSGVSKSVRFATPPPYGATPPLGGSKTV